MNPVTIEVFHAGECPVVEKICLVLHKVVSSSELEAVIRITEVVNGDEACAGVLPGVPLIRIGGEDASGAAGCCSLSLPAFSDDFVPSHDLLRHGIAKAAGLRTVLFVCTGNAVRSQMAEGIVNRFLRGKWAAFSGGVIPMEIPEDVVKVMYEIGVDISSCRPKHVDTFKGLHFDRVVLLCSDASRMCPGLPDYEEREYIFFRDPFSSLVFFEGVCFSLRSTFRGLRDDIRKKLMKYLEG
ncbi:MAG: arsenate reductase ArsC [Alphaproteobacteria bacterium]|uniref:Arsenate reductase ArsC n=1 Tax=Candidatus Nitrobium versatile TaxID=2884831 RepID=A0A953J3A9_9BACT|nr:arsenate reductase ArsC [Candidatus Nitrobium versatile]